MMQADEDAMQELPLDQYIKGNPTGKTGLSLRYSFAMRACNRARRFSVDCLMKAMFSPRCCSALIFPSSRRFSWSSPNCAIAGPSSWFSDFQIAAQVICFITGYLSQGGSTAHAALQLAPSRMNANVSVIMIRFFVA